MFLRARSREPVVLYLKRTGFLRTSHEVRLSYLFPIAFYVAASLFMAVVACLGSFARLFCWLLSLLCLLGSAGAAWSILRDLARSASMDLDDMDDALTRDVMDS